MKIANKEWLDEFAYRHADALRPLQRWAHIVEREEWKSHTDLKASFPSADYVGNSRYVFNIKGNSYRLVVVVIFVVGLLVVQFVGTHKDYDKINCKNI